MMYKVNKNHSFSRTTKDSLSFKINLEVDVDGIFMIIIFSNNVQVWEHGQ